MNKYSDIEFTCKDVRGLSIVCLYEDWQYLIKHQEMRDQQKVVKDIIESPDFINQSRDFPNRHTYYKLTELPKIGEARQKVVVEFKGGFLKAKKGYIYNAYLCLGEQKGEARLWTKK